MRTVLAIAVAGFVLNAMPVSAQKVPRGVHSYGIFGEGEYGSQMAPWTGAITVSDTTFGSATAMLIHTGARADGDTWRFNTRSVMPEIPPRTYRMEATGISGAGTSACTADVAGRTITAGDQKAGPFDADVVHENALAFVIAGMPLRDGLPVNLVAFRCEDLERGITTNRLNASVSTGLATRFDNADAEAVWIVTGDAAFPFKAAIAKSDGMPLSFEIPQSPSDRMIFRYRETRPRK